jgi:phage terminase Nu1 subunit (DNA packaging protein)
MTKVETKVDGFKDKEILTGELAVIVNKSPQWIRQLTREKVLTQVGRGKYRLGDSVQAYIEHTSGGKEDKGKPRFIDYKTEHERIKVEQAAIKLTQMREDLHTAEDIETVMDDMFTAFRQRVLSIPTKLAQHLTGIDDVNMIKSLLTKEIHEALTELSNYDPELVKDHGAQSEVMK